MHSLQSCRLLAFAQLFLPNTGLLLEFFPSSRPQLGLRPILLQGSESTGNSEKKKASGRGLGAGKREKAELAAKVLEFTDSPALVPGCACEL